MLCIYVGILCLTTSKAKSMWVSVAVTLVHIYVGNSQHNLPIDSAAFPGDLVSSFDWWCPAGRDLVCFSSRAHCRYPSALNGMHESRCDGPTH